MFTKIATKFKGIKEAAIVASLTAVTTPSFAQVSSGGADANFQRVGRAMDAFLKLLPTGARIAGVIVMIGGLWAMYSHYKSGGRDGSIAAGIAGIVIGAGLFFLGGMLNFGADVTGIDKSATLPGAGAY